MVKSLLGIPELAKPVPKADELCALWHAIKEGKETSRTLFQTRTVVRDQGSSRASADVPVPESCCVFTGLPSTQKTFKITGMLIREEYLKALSDVILYAAELKTDFARDSDKDENGTSIFLSQLNPFKNPFDDPSSRVRNQAAGGVAIVGHPGIGKSIWLLFVLVLRLLARLPTIYMRRPNQMLLFTEDGVFSVDPDEIVENVFMQYLPESIWCLVDSNQELIEVPLVVQTLDVFIVQACSPRPQRIEWTKKALAKVFKYMSKPWTLPELIVGRAFQLRAQQVNEKQLEEYFSRFSPSARLAYDNAKTIPRYEKDLVDMMVDLSHDKLTSIVKNSSQMNMSTELSYQIMMVIPGETRHEAEVVIPTHHIYHMLRDRFEQSDLEETARLYRIFTSYARTRATAGYMLEDGMHALLSPGGYWKLKVMVKSEKKRFKNQHWRTPPKAAAHKYLCLGSPQDTLRILSQEPIGEVYTRLTCRSFLHKQKITLTSGYYRPQSDSHPTLDAFFYDENTKTATIFQTTVSKKHSVKVQGIKWLRDTLGVTNIHYVAVTPNVELDLPFPLDIDGEVQERYQLVVVSLDSIRN